LKAISNYQSTIKLLSLIRICNPKVLSGRICNPIFKLFAICRSRRITNPLLTTSGFNNPEEQ
ncbi:MAG: hypothetical protein LPK21_17590, partial [Hymenobacteraceae bacterium]|nr:hypothetical protein [Hymenobacteraceae bacterium]